MNRDQPQHMASLAARVRMAQGQGIVLGGGFAQLANQQLTNWQDVVMPFQGELRLVPAVNAQGLKLWRYATAKDLVRWVLSGRPGWRGDFPPVVAMGSLFLESETPLVTASDRAGRHINLTTTCLGLPSDQIGQKMRALLHLQPRALALCVVPRG